MVDVDRHIAKQGMGCILSPTTVWVACDRRWLVQVIHHDQIMATIWRWQKIGQWPNGGTTPFKMAKKGVRFMTLPGTVPATHKSLRN